MAEGKREGVGTHQNTQETSEKEIKKKKEKKHPSDMHRIRLSPISPSCKIIIQNTQINNTYLDCLARSLELAALEMKASRTPFTARTGMYHIQADKTAGALVFKYLFRDPKKGYQR